MDRKHPDVGKYVRAEACTSNAFETLPLFACAVLAGAVARLPLEQQHKFAMSYVGLRALYSVSSGGSIISKIKTYSLESIVPLRQDYE